MSGHRVTLAAAGCLVVAVALGGCGTNSSAASAGGGGQADPTSALVDQRCTMCHTRDRIDSATYDAAKWTSTIARMKRNGLVITDAEAQRIADYLGSGQ